LPISSSALNIEFIQHIEYIQDGATLYGFLDAVPGVYDPSAMSAGSKLDAVAPVGLVETAVDRIEVVTDVIRRLSSVGSTAMGVISEAASFAGLMSQARGFSRSPGQSPFARLMG